MYIKDGKPVPTPDPQAGLYICNRAGQVVQASIPPNHIAFQLGQVLSIQSGGLLRATPHYVRAAAAGGPGISRNTFAVFMQPDLGVVLNPPKGLEVLGCLLCMDSGHWSAGEQGWAAPGGRGSFGKCRVKFFLHSVPHRLRSTTQAYVPRWCATTYSGARAPPTRHLKA